MHYAVVINSNQNLTRGRGIHTVQTCKQRMEHNEIASIFEHTKSDTNECKNTHTMNIWNQEWRRNKKILIFLSCLNLSYNGFLFITLIFFILIYPHSSDFLLHNEFKCLFVFYHFSNQSLIIFNILIAHCYLNVI